MTAQEARETLKFAISELEKLEQIRNIVNSSYRVQIDGLKYPMIRDPQEDALRYKMICEVLEIGEKK